MEYFRDELLPEVYLTALRTDRFETACLRSALVTPLRRETASARALIPFVLGRGTAYSPDAAGMDARLKSLGGAQLEPLVRKRGELQCPGLLLTFSREPSLTAAIAALMGELWLSPNTRGGLFLPAYVDGEREKLLERLDRQTDDRHSRALHLLTEKMCAFEDYATHTLGDRETAEALRYPRLTKDYRALLSASPMELFYCGAAPLSRVREELVAALRTLPRSGATEELGTDIRMNAVEESPRLFIEETEGAGNTLAVGFRLGACMEEPEPAALRVFNLLYGGGDRSRLGRHLRAHSALDIHKGLLTVVADTDTPEYEATLAEIQGELAALARGELSREELDAAKELAAQGLRSLQSSPRMLESFYFGQTLLGLDHGPAELAALTEDVTASELAELAAGVECDAAVFLRGQETPG